MDVIGKIKSVMDRKMGEISYRKYFS